MFEHLTLLLEHGLVEFSGCYWPQTPRSVVCRLPVLEDVRAAAHALAVPPAPAPAPAPVTAPAPAVLAAQEDLDGAAPVARGYCGATPPSRQEAQGTR